MDLALRLQHFFETEVVMALFQGVECDLFVVLRKNARFSLWKHSGTSGCELALLRAVRVDHRHFRQFVRELRVVLLWR